MFVLNTVSLYVSEFGLVFSPGSWVRFLETIRCLHRHLAFDNLEVESEMDVSAPI